MVRFCGKCGRILAFIAARCAAYEFLFARTARIFVALRQKAQKLALFSAFLACALFSLTCFWVFRVCARLSWCVFVSWERSHAFPGAFWGFGSIPTTSPTYFQPLGVFPRIPLEHFQPLGVLLRIPRRIFSLLEHSHRFPEAFSAERFKIPYPIRTRARRL